MSDVGDVNEIHTRPRYFKKKPVVVEASPWFRNGDHPEDNVGGPAVDPFTGETYKRIEGAVVKFFRNPDIPDDKPCEHCGVAMLNHGWIDTLEGGHKVCPGDWIITGVQGERYPCKPDIFAETYDEVSIPNKVVIELNE